MRRPSPSETVEQRSPRKVWGGGKSVGGYVSIRLVPKGVTDLSGRETVAELKVNSSQLKKCSKYFEVCLSERWENPNSSAPSMEFDLEMIHGLQVASYIDCFSRMDSSLRKAFRDVLHCLELLRVASQIEFDELISSICKCLSIIHWSDEDELRIRQYSSSPDFPSSQAQGLVARLGGSQAESQKRISDLIQLCTHTVLQCNRCPDKNFASARSFLEVFFIRIGQSGSPAFNTNMVMIVSNEARAMLVDFHEECIREAYDGDRKKFKRVYKVRGFVHKLEAVCWVLQVLVTAKVADDVVNCFLLLDKYPQILAGTANRSAGAALAFARLMVDIHREVVAGNVLVGMPARVALLERWKLLQLCPGSIWKAVILSWGYARAVEDVFFTLPFGLQMRLVRRRRFDYEGLISPSALASLVKKKWAAAEEDQALLQAEEESDD